MAPGHDQAFYSVTKVKLDAPRASSGSKTGCSQGAFRNRLRGPGPEAAKSPPEALRRPPHLGGHFEAFGGSFSAPWGIIFDLPSLLCSSLCLSFTRAVREVAGFGGAAPCEIRPPSFLRGSEGAAVERTKRSGHEYFELASLRSSNFLHRS